MGWYGWEDEALIMGIRHGLRKLFILSARVAVLILGAGRACLLIRAVTSRLPWAWGQPLIAHLSPHLNSRRLADARIRTKHGFRMRLNMDDTSVQRYIFFLGQWEPETTVLIRSLLTEGDVFLDIGANAGFFSLLAAGIVGRHGRVYAIEAQPAICDELRRNIAMNAFQNVAVENRAVTERVCTVSVEDVSRLGNRGAATLVARGPGMPMIEVQGTSIDEFCMENGVEAIRLIKMDIEGAEMLALRGACRLLSSPQAPDLICEINDRLLKRLGSGEEEVLNFLSGFGYQIYRFGHGRLDIASAGTLQTPTNPLGENYFFSKRMSAVDTSRDSRSYLKPVRSVVGN